MIYKKKFNVTGTTEQQNLVIAALDNIHFPWDKLKFPSEPVEIGWRNLNQYASIATGSIGSRMHGGAHHPAGEDKPDTLTGDLEGVRNYTLGIFYIGSGRIYIDLALVKYPDIAKATVSAEIAHAVDYFLPSFSDAVRDEIMALMHGGDRSDHGHSWWEKHDYGAEYFTLVGEAMMQAFTVAYSDIPFGNASDFTHGITADQAPALRKIIGIERTDKPLTKYEVFGTSSIYHKMDHYDKPGRDGTIITDPTGYRPCKICRPDL